MRRTRGKLKIKVDTWRTPFFLLSCPFFSFILSISFSLLYFRLQSCNKFIPLCFKFEYICFMKWPPYEIMNKLICTYTSIIKLGNLFLGMSLQLQLPLDGFPSLFQKPLYKHFIMQTLVMLETGKLLCLHVELDLWLFALLMLAIITCGLILLDSFHQNHLARTHLRLLLCLQCMPHCGSGYQNMPRQKKK